MCCCFCLFTKYSCVYFLFNTLLLYVPALAFASVCSASAWLAQQKKWFYDLIRKK